MQKTCLYDKTFIIMVFITMGYTD